MSLDLKKLANKLDKALSNETSETLNKFLTDKRMSNNKQIDFDLQSFFLGILTGMVISLIILTIL